MTVAAVLSLLRSSSTCLLASAGALQVMEDSRSEPFLVDMHTWTEDLSHLSKLWGSELKSKHEEADLDVSSYVNC